MPANERVFVVNADLPLNDLDAPAGIEIADGRIRNVLPMSELASTSGARVIDAGGRSVLPAFTDAHVHVVESGIELMRCDLTGAAGRDDTVRRIADYRAAHPDADWILGRGWALSHFHDTARMLDELDRVTGAVPAYLANRDGHSAWVNTAALRRAGITADTPDPHGGAIERAVDGHPVGLLHEAAMQLVSNLLPPLDDATRRAGLIKGQDRLLSLGITGWQEAIVGDFVPTTDVLTVYRDAASDGTLVGRVTGNLWVPRTGFADCAARFAELRASIPAESRLQLTGAKIMYDGVCETFTAAVSRPYRAPVDHPLGLTFFDVDDLVPVVDQLDRHGFDIHIHAIGDRGIEDSIALLETVAGRGTDRRHQIAHLQLTNPALIRRMSVAGIVGNLQPYWAHADDQMLELTIPFLDPELARHQYEFATMQSEGVRLAFGSDWPVSSPNPFDAIHVAVNRTLPGASTQPFLPAEALTRRHALQAATAGGAFASRHEEHRGRLEPGLDADLVLLDRRLDEVDDADLCDVTVTSTLVRGQAVFVR
jgi:predicted amidohydrolase YtcJ